MTRKTLAEEAITRSPVRAQPLEPRWESTTNAARIYKVAPKTIREHIASGDFNAVFFGRVLRVDLNSIDEFLRPVNGGNR